MLLHLHGHSTAASPRAIPGAEDESLLPLRAGARPVQHRQDAARSSASFPRADTSVVRPRAPRLQRWRLHPAGDRACRRTSGRAARRRRRAGVILSGHSGAAAASPRCSAPRRCPAGPRTSRHLEAFFSFDTINGKDTQKVSEIEDGPEYTSSPAFVLARLDADLQMLQAAGANRAARKEPQVQASLAAKLRRRGLPLPRLLLRVRRTSRKAIRGGSSRSAAADVCRPCTSCSRARSTRGSTPTRATWAARARSCSTRCGRTTPSRPSGTDHMHDMGGPAGAQEGLAVDGRDTRAALGSLPTRARMRSVADRP